MDHSWPSWGVEEQLLMGPGVAVVPNLLLSWSLR